jgi:hypothetical protein
MIAFSRRDSAVSLKQTRRLAKRQRAMMAAIGLTLGTARFTRF